MELFTTVIKEGTVLYRGTKGKDDIPLQSLPSWFGDIKTAELYGSYIHSYRVVRRLKLINIIHPVFHADFTSKLNIKYGENYRMKGKILAPIGLPDFATQMKYISRVDGGIYKEPVTEQEKIDKSKLDTFLPFYEHKHRYSNETQMEKLDILMANEIKLLYPDHDGYISETLWPSYHHNGFVHPETCLFNPYISVVPAERTFQHGGSKDNEDFDEYVRGMIRPRIILLSEPEPNIPQIGGKEIQQRKRATKPKATNEEKHTPKNKRKTPVKPKSPSP